VVAIHLNLFKATHHSIYHKVVLATKALQPRMNQAETDGVPPSVYILGCKHGKVEQKSAPVF
jgi:hypothetical protein